MWKAILIVCSTAPFALLGFVIADFGHVSTEAFTHS
jgi:hypothetical protein